jgi:DNA-directed RNA polymerase I subunit RPA43
VSLLVHRTFNVSIPRYHIPEDTWEFEYGPAENDPEFGPQATHIEETAEGNIDVEHEEGDAGGKWIHKVTGQKIGGIDGLLEFTVIG